ncbi:MAG TPA: hypothetical protein O0X70_02165 [Methanocorpusculum sp.]|nr:hypothetical protein [Methanocorpusculum sp.]
MSTRCYIGVRNHDESATFIYCHCDGYPQGVGQTLLNFYPDRAKVNQLIGLGDLFSLGTSIENCDADVRDGGEDWADNLPVTIGGARHPERYALDIEWRYIFELDDTWSCSEECSGCSQPLTWSVIEDDWQHKH